MPDYLGKSKAERDHVRALLIKRHGELQIAARKMEMSVFTLSRILNGRQGELVSLVKILKASGLLENRKYRFPKDDLETFYYLNGIMNFSLK